MKVSIITVVYNNKRYIEDCIESVIDQTYRNIEYIVVDGGSTDGTQESVKTFKDNIAYSVSEKDNGLYNALNKGIRKATGDIIGILHSDDLFFQRDTIKVIVNSFKSSKADLIYANGIYVDKEKINKTLRVYKAKSFKYRYLWFGWIPLHTTIFVRKEIFNKFGLYDESFEIASDYEISLRWFKNKEIKKYFLNEFVVKMRIGGKSTNLKLQKRKSIEDLEIIYSNNLLGYITLICKIFRKIPQYIIPRITNI